MAKPLRLQKPANEFEERVFNFLQEALPDSYTVATSSTFGKNGREVDLLVIGPNGVFTIEAKDVRGHIRRSGNTEIEVVDERGKVYDFSDRYEAPYSQARKQGQVVSGFLEKTLGSPHPWVRTMLVFPEGSNIEVPEGDRDIQRSTFEPVVVTLNELPRYIKDFASPRWGSLSPALIKILAKVIKNNGSKVLTKEEWAVVREWQRQQVRGRRDKGGEGKTPYEKSRSDKDAFSARGRTRTHLRNVVLGSALAGLMLIAVVGGVVLAGNLFFSFFKVFDKGRHSVAEMDATAQVQVTLPVATSHKVAVVPSPTLFPITPSLLASSVAVSPTITATVVPTATPSQGNWSTSINGLTLRVKKIEPTQNSFKVWMEAVNQTPDTITLPLFMNFYVVDDLGNQYSADPFASSWQRNVAPGARISGYAYMKGTLDKRAKYLKVMFSVVYGTLRIQSISVEHIPVPSR